MGMNKQKLIKVSIAFIFIFALYSLINVVSAKTSFDRISVDIKLQDNGDARVTETWVADVNSGTELYHPYYNLGNSKIKDLSVSYKGKSYTYLDVWDVDQTRSYKAYKCGLNKTKDGVEVCWGCNEYGNNQRYVVNYTITNFVSELSDSQMIYWTIIPHDFSSSIGEVNITMTANHYISDSIDVWGYGKKGALCYVSDGKIRMHTTNLQKDEYMTILVKFPSGTFNTSNELDYDFNHFFKKAEEGASKFNKAFYVIFLNFVQIIGPLLFTIFIGILGSKFRKSNNYNFSYGKEGRYLGREINYFRDIPLGGDLPSAYFLSEVYNISKKKELNIIGAYFLKWIKEKKIILEPTTVGLIVKKDTYNVHLVYTDPFEDSIESELYDILVRASKDRILENKEFERWAKTNYAKVERWLESAANEGKERLCKLGLINKIEKTSFLINRTTYEATPELKQEALKLAGLKKYLEEYTLIDQRQAPEVELFETYLIYAQIFGIADKVSEEFKSLYPDMINHSCYNSYDFLLYANSYSRIMTTSVFRSAATARMVAAAIRYTAGGGGFSSGGGGGGSFGGGGGGGGSR